MPQLSCENLAIGYEGKTIARNINFNINEGDYLCILGENGSGKSTLMKTILGLEKQLSGSIKLGENITCREFGYLTQRSELQRDFPASVKEVVYSGLQSKSRFSPFYKKSDKMLAQSIMEKMNVLDFQNRCFRKLSGGQQQRVLLSRSLCAAKKILFLDEPMAGLDANVSVEFYSMIERLNREENLTIVMISHDIQASLKYASHILHVGNDVLFCTKEEYLTSSHAHIFNISDGGKKDGTI